jgi:hypothetical protein
MKLSSISMILAIVLLIGIAAPAAALFELYNVQVEPPDASLPPGTPVNITAMIRPIPTDSFQTFITWNYIRLSTDLEDPRWNVMTHANAIQVPVGPTTSENIVDIEGTLLSHPINTNVTVNIQLDGRVPGNATGPLTVLKAEEIDQGKVVGPVQVVSVFIAPSGATNISAPPTGTVPATTPTKAALPLVLVPAGVVAALGILGRKRR